MNWFLFFFNWHHLKVTFLHALLNVRKGAPFMTQVSGCDSYRRVESAVTLSGCTGSEGDEDGEGPPRPLTILCVAGNYRELR